jgi:hypothetical protein
MDDTSYAVMIGVLPFVPFFLALMFGAFGRRTTPLTRAEKVVAWHAVAGLVGIAVVLFCVLINQSAAMPAGPVPAAPLRVDPPARVAPPVIPAQAMIVQVGRVR